MGHVWQGSVLVRVARLKVLYVDLNSKPYILNPKPQTPNRLRLKVLYFDLNP